MKQGKDGTPPVNEARLVAWGFEQQQGIDYEKTFASVIKWNILCFIINKIASKQWKILQLDVKIAFLCTLLKKMVVMEHPQEFEVKGYKNKVYLLNKTLYGLKQGVRAWNNTINYLIISLGLKKNFVHGTCTIKLIEKYIFAIVVRR